MEPACSVTGACSLLKKHPHFQATTTTTSTLNAPNVQGSKYGNYRFLSIPELHERAKSSSLLVKDAQVRKRNKENVAINREGRLKLLQQQLADASKKKSGNDLLSLVSQAHDEGTAF